MDLPEFDRQLREIVPEDSRPFLCEGSPFGCEVFLVGLNPRTHTPFWEVWDASYGCRKNAWLNDYRKRHDGKLGPTRCRIERLLERLRPFRCLETNLYVKWTDRFANLPKEDRSPDVFNVLVKTIRPRLLFIHGRAIRIEIERYANCSLPLRTFRGVNLNGDETWVYATHHLSFQLSMTKCREIGDEIRKHLESLNRR